jgi:hypothetical protein
MDTSDLINYYAGLLIVQYASLPNALATVQAYISALIQNQIIQQVQDGFDVKTAIGAQLDILGTYRGITRNAYGLAPGSYWSLPSYSDTLPGGFFGWASYADANPPLINWLQYNDTNSVPYAMTDPQMSLLIQLKAKLDSWDGTLGSLDSILYSFFTTYVTVIDQENMTIIYQHQNIDPDPNQLWTVAVLQNVFPHPAGVGVTFVGV